MMLKLVRDVKTRRAFALSGVKSDYVKGNEVPVRGIEVGEVKRRP